MKLAGSYQSRTTPERFPKTRRIEAARKRGRTEAAEVGGDGSSGGLCCGECRALKTKLQRAERRIVLINELAALGGSGEAD